jgi:hypothetical protein
VPAGDQPGHSNRKPQRAEQDHRAQKNQGAQDFLFALGAAHLMDGNGIEAEVRQDAEHLQKSIGGIVVTRQLHTQRHRHELHAQDGERSHRDLTHHLPDGGGGDFAGDRWHRKHCTVFCITYPVFRIDSHFIKDTKYHIRNTVYCVCYATSISSPHFHQATHAHRERCDPLRGQGNGEGLRERWQRHAQE